MSVIGSKELNHILRAHNARSIPKYPSSNRFRFGNSTYNSIGIVQFFLATPQGVPAITVQMDVVPVDIPALLGLDILDSCALYSVTVTILLLHWLVASSTVQPLAYNDEWAVPLRRHDSHVSADVHMPACTFFTRTELLKIQNQFAHPSAQRPYKLLRQPYPNEVSSNTLNVLE